jgi:hypothetical protein
MENQRPNTLLGKWLRVLFRVGFPFALVLVFVMCGLHRLLGEVLAASGLILYLLSYWRRTARAALALVALSVLSLVSPLDICTLHDRRLSYTAGKIGIRPLIVGMPTNDTSESAERGEVVLGGCITSGYDPKYVITW